MLIQPKGYSLTAGSPLTPASSRIVAYDNEASRELARRLEAFGLMSPEAAGKVLERAGVTIRAQIAKRTFKEAAVKVGGHWLIQVKGMR